MAKNTLLMKRRFTDCVSTLVAAGSDIGTGIFTVTNRVIIRGWDFESMIQRFTPSIVVAAAYMRCEVTRATTMNTDFVLDSAAAVYLPLQDVAGADYVGAAGSLIAKLERHLSTQEAEELGLVLDYGESIRILQALTQVAAGATEAVTYGFFLYQDI